MDIWIISDTHFNNKTMVENYRRPEGYQEMIIKNWKECVKENDLIIHLGDVIDSKCSELEQILGGLPGEKRLIKGNHDTKPDNWYLKKGFDKVSLQEDMLFGDYNISFTHIPLIHLKNKKGEDVFNVHGHLHIGHRFEEFKNIITSKHILYSAELRNYRPILLQDLLPN